jgi:hypothetical protein
MSSNKNSATEDRIGVLHELITKCHNIKAQAMIDMVDDLVRDGAEPEEVGMLINARDLSTMQKWVEYNGVSCKLAEDDSESELSKKLAALKQKQKGKIVDFQEAKEA